MTTAFGILCVTLVVYAYLIELVLPHKPDAVHPIPVRLTGTIHCEYFENGRITHGVITPGIHEVGKDNGYIIGVILGGVLCPFIARRPDLHNKVGRVKIRIDGNIANVTEPIRINDPLNHKFFYDYDTEDPEHCIDVVVPNYNLRP